MTETVDIALREWQTATPDSHRALAGLSFGRDEDARQTANELEKNRILSTTELASGLRITSRSWVGTTILGQTHVTVRPKIAGNALLTLLRYAYRLRDLRLFDLKNLSVDDYAIQDVLIHQLLVEVTELVARGLHRKYKQQSDSLVSPRGRIDFAALAKNGIVRASLPCHHHNRLEDCLVNQVVLAGLRLGAATTTDISLRVRVRQLIRQLEERISAIVLDGVVFRRLQTEMNRLTRAYEPAVRLVEILYSHAGVAISGERQPVSIPGFMFDMNLFFQELLTRFLTENLPQFEVRDQYRLHGMFTYVEGFNPQSRQSPTPRPDYVILRQGRVVAIVDAKYRDLWEHALPREMLYQLALYALSTKGIDSSVILYPTNDEAATEARVALHHPLRNTPVATVALRPVLVSKLADLVAGDGVVARRAREQYARWLVFGA